MRHHGAALVGPLDRLEAARPSLGSLQRGQLVVRHRRRSASGAPRTAHLVRVGVIGLGLGVGLGLGLGVGLGLGLGLGSGLGLGLG